MLIYQSQNVTLYGNRAFADVTSEDEVIRVVHSSDMPDALIKNGNLDTENLMEDNFAGQKGRT